MAVFAALPIIAAAQGSSLNTYSPYTFYGIGDISAQGSASVRSMGGAGLAMRNQYRTNLLNPASYSAIPQRCAMLSVGIEGQNFYLKDANLKSSFNTFNITDISLHIPFAKKLGFVVGVMPYSNIGYRLSNVVTDGNVGADIGRVTYAYNGSGNVSLIKAGVGYELFKGVSLGVEMAYYHGNVTRKYDATFEPLTGSGTFINMQGQRLEQINTILANFGLQANVLNREETELTLAFVYNMGGKLKGHVKSYIPANNFSGDDVRLDSYISGFRLPHQYNVGVSFSKPKYRVSADYSYADWSVNESDAVNGISYRATHTVKAGAEFTPNAGDVRNFMKRITYRAGFRYADYYMLINGHAQQDIALTLGVGIPIGFARKNNIDVGVELGTMGTTNYGLINSKYFKVVVGFTLFGDDYWFTKFKYD